jgi:predicted nucleotide-binding protein (sugar kinase/HSP70/actin superfamily)
MNNVDLKPIVDATTDLVRKTVQNVTDVQTRMVKDVVAFNDAVIKAQTEMMKAIPGNVFADVYTNAAKMQSDAMKTASTWTEKLHSTK